MSETATAFAIGLCIGIVFVLSITVLRSYLAAAKREAEHRFKYMARTEAADIVSLHTDFKFKYIYEELDQIQQEKKGKKK